MNTSPFPPITPTDIRSWEMMMLKYKICRARNFLFHGSLKRRKILKPMVSKNNVRSSKERGSALVFATPRIEIAVIHSLLSQDQCGWARLPDKKTFVKKTILIVPMGGVQNP